MIGNNTLTLNEATIKAAVQMYLDSLRKLDAPAQEVQSVKPDGQLFEVELASPIEGT